MLKLQGKFVASLHIPPILPTHFKQRIGNLPERAHTNCVHQHYKHVFVLDRRLLEALQRGAAEPEQPRWESALYAFALAESGFSVQEFIRYDAL